jgi:hypothetical protein
MSLTRDGGKPNVKELPYSPPTGGPNTLNHEGPGLGGDNYGNGQQPVCNEREIGSPGLHGTIKRP